MPVAESSQASIGATHSMKSIHVKVGSSEFWFLEELLPCMAHVAGQGVAQKSGAGLGRRRLLQLLVLPGTFASEADTQPRMASSRGDACKARANRQVARACGVLLAVCLLNWAFLIA